jgi:hypothetical protein
MRKSGEMVRNGKVVCMMDWRDAGHVENVSVSLHFCTRVHPSAGNI